MISVTFEVHTLDNGEVTILVITNPITAKEIARRASTEDNLEACAAWLMLEAVQERMAGMGARPAKSFAGKTVKAN